MKVPPPSAEKSAEKPATGKDIKSRSGSDAFESNLFQLLLSMPVGGTAAPITDTGDQYQSGGSNQNGVSSRQSPLNALDLDTETPFTNLLEKIAVNALDGDFNCTMFLPHLGEVAVSATQTPAKWQLHLEFMNQRGFDYCRTAHRRLKKDLADKLGKAVQLGLEYRGRRYEDRDDD